MKLELDTKRLADILSAVTNFTKSPHANLVVKGENTYVVAQGQGVFLRLLVLGCTVEQEGGLTFNVSVFSNLIKGRSKMRIEHAEGAAEVKFASVGRGRKYDGTMVVLPQEDIKPPRTGDTTDVELSTAMHNLTQAAIQQIQLADIYTGAEMFASVRADKAGFTAVCYDKYHMAMFQAKPTVKLPPLSMTLPLATFQNIAQLVGETEYKLRITESSIQAVGASFLVVLPLAQSATDTDIEQAVSFKKECEASPADASFSIEAQALSTTLDNMYGVYEEKSAVSLVSKGDTVTFELVTNYGKIRESFRVKNVKWKAGAKFLLDPNLLSDLIRLVDAKAILNFKLVEDKYASIQVEDREGASSAFYFCSLQ